MSPKPLPTILVAHNRYQQKGGEDSVVESEVAMLRAHGHEVVEYVRSNDELKGRSLPAAALSALWSSESARQLKQLIAQSGADIVHVHNTFPVMSPSVYWAAAQAGVPVVQTLHNFRLACPQAMFLREGKVCEQCIGTVPWRAVVHRCYRDSAAQSAVSMATITLHRALGTYTHKVSRFIALNGFCQSKFIEMGLPSHKIAIKPNFVKPMADPAWDGRDGGVFVGRLSGEKGITTLLAALKQAPGMPLQVVGGGEHEAAVRAQLGSGYLGFQPLDEVIALMRRSAYLVLPSIWYENFPRTIVEAYSVGLPVIASRIGALTELVEDGQTGLLVKPGDAADLAEKLQWAQAHPEQMLAMGRRAYAKFNSEYSAERNYALLQGIYADCLREARKG